MGKIATHPDETPGVEFRVFVNGKLLTKAAVYNFAFQRALGVATYLDMLNDFENPKSKNVIDKWSNGKDLIVVSKHIEKS